MTQFAYHDIDSGKKRLLATKKISVRRLCIGREILVFPNFFAHTNIFVVCDLKSNFRRTGSDTSGPWTWQVIPEAVIETSWMKFVHTYVVTELLTKYCTMCMLEYVFHSY